MSASLGDQAGNQSAAGSLVRRDALSRATSTVQMSGSVIAGPTIATATLFSSNEKRGELYIPGPPRRPDEPPSRVNHRRLVVVPREGPKASAPLGDAAMAPYPF